ncbi:MAG: hypothetical protein K2J20_00805 [Bacilli bacterium]|nr:hypothetical protein [Bacilli bacterium]
MKRLKKFWREYSVLLVLLLILIACLVAISVVVVTYFVGDSSTKYGDRLDGIDKYPFTEETQKEIITKLEEDELIEKANFQVHGKRIRLYIKFTTASTLVEAQSKALASLENFAEDTLSFYDLEYSIEADSTEKTDGFHMSGTHSKSGSGGIVWENNTIYQDEED